MSLADRIRAVRDAKTTAGDVAALVAAVAVVVAVVLVRRDFREG